jgi:hypothetical protein
MSIFRLIIPLMTWSISIDAVAPDVIRIEEDDGQLLRLTEDLVPWVREIRRPLHLFHYTTRAEVVGTTEAPDRNDSRVYSYISRQASRFWEDLSTCDPCTYGKGLYAASDAQYSLQFGGTDWALIKIALRPGTRFINADQATLGPGSLRFLKDLGCTRTDPYSNGRYGGRKTPSGDFWNLFGHEGSHCHWLLKTVIKKLRIQTVGYYWGDGFLSDLPACSKRKNLDFLLIHDSAVDPLNTEVFTKKIPRTDEEASSRAHVNEVFRHISGAPLWDLGGKRPDIKRYVSDHFFGCGETPEDL